MKNLLYVLYRQFKEGRSKEIAYEKAVLIFLLLIFVNIISALSAMNLMESLIIGVNSRNSTFLIFGVGYFLPAYLLLNFFVNKKDMEQMEFNFSYEMIMYAYVLLTLFFFVVSIAF